MRNAAVVFLALPLWAVPGVLLDQTDVRHVLESRGSGG
jgi:hypothetical protein